MVSRYASLGAYAVLVAAAASAWVIYGLAHLPAGGFPSPLPLLVCIGSCLFVWWFGLNAPRVVLTSMERLPQIGALLIFEPAVAAATCAVASFLWPFVSRRAYSYGSLGVAAIRGIHNAGMTAIMLLIGAKVYLATGGTHAPVTIGLADIWPLVAMALAVQLANIVFMSMYYFFDGRDVRRLIKPIYSLIDLMFVPAGVLTALLYNSQSGAVFALFAGLMAVFVLSFNGIGGSLSVAENESSPLARLLRAQRGLRGARKLDDLGERIAVETGPLFRFDELYFVLVNRDENVLEVRVHERHGQRLAARRKPLDSGLFGWAVKNHQSVLVEHWDRAPEAIRKVAEETDKKTGSLLIAPLRENGQVIGLLSVQHTRAGAYTTADQNLIEQLAEQISVAAADARAFEDLESYRQNLEQRVAERTRELQAANRDKEALIAALNERSRTLERESHEDPLTGIANRRLFNQRLAAEVEAARAAGQPLTLAVADIDRFKVINDRFGHASGDEVLRRAADIMRRQCRAIDLVARIGGEEFALVLTGMTRDVATGYCDLLRRAFESHEWREIHPQLRVTMSIGIAQWNGKSDPAGLLQAADVQLYSAKDAGRNRVA